MPSLEGGGAERMMVNLANALVVRGYTVDLVVIKFEGSYRDRVDAKVRVVDLCASRVLFALPKLVAYFRRARPAALLSVLSHCNVVACMARRLSGVDTRLVISERNMISGYDTEGLFSQLLLRLMRWAYPMADHMVAISEGVARDLKESIGSIGHKTSVIYNPVIDEWLLKKSREAIDHPWLKEGCVPVVLAAGRLVPQKDFVTLLRAFALVRRKRQVRLMILGEGPLHTELYDLAQSLGIAGDVAFMGFVANPWAYMSRSALFVLSSLQEGFGNVLVEAMACGVPVISTNCPSGPSEILADGHWGVLVPIQDPVAMATAISDRLSKPPATDERERAACFEVRYSVDQYLRVLVPLVSQSDGSVL